jgi:HlyD family secretion protein
VPSSFFSGGRLVAAVLVLVVVGVIVAGRDLLSGAPEATDATVEVTRGTYVDIIEVRGQIEPVRSTYVMAPFNAGELQILEIVQNGATVKTGDVVARFDAVNLQRTIQEKQGELRSARAELDQNMAQSRITLEERKATVAKAEFDVIRAKLALGEIGLVSEIEAARNQLALADAEQRLSEARAALASAEANAQADREARERTIAKVQAELDRAERQVSALQVTAPTDGTVNILPNTRNANFLAGGTPQEYRRGDRAYPGAIILELPDLSSVFLTARIDEADRGRLVEGQSALIRLDAIADRDYAAVVTGISLLARTDFQSGWPPPKQFDLTMSITNPDERLRPGMSAAARVTVGELADALLVPVSSIFYEAGRTVVYRQTRRAFEPVPVDVVRRSREQAAIEGAVSPGDRISRVRPGSSPEEAQP